MLGLPTTNQEVDENNTDQEKDARRGPGFTEPGFKELMYGLLISQP